MILERKQLSDGNLLHLSLCCSCRDSSVEKMSSAPFSDTFKLFFGISQHLLCDGMIGFCYFAFGVILEDTFSGRAGFGSADRPGNSLVEHFQILSVGLPNQIADLLPIDGAAVVMVSRMPSIFSFGFICRLTFCTV